MANEIRAPLQPLRLPDLTQAPQLLRIVVFAQALALLLALAVFTPETFWHTLGLVSILVHWVSITSAVVFSLLRTRFQSFSIPRLALAVQIILICSTLCCSMISYALFYGEVFNPAWWVAVGHHVLIAVIVGLVLTQFLIMYNELSHSLAEQHQARFSALQARIRPHFLFNSLNTVAELIHSDPQAAEQALLNLAALFRAAMASADRISLQDEVLLCQQYLSLEQWRLGDRLIVKWQVPTTLPVVNIPALTIQPLLENAVQYGFETRTTVGELTVSAYVGKKQLSIIIENPIAGSEKKGPKNGIAIRNIRQRLLLCFGQHAQLITLQEDRRYRVKLVLPLES